MAIMPEPGKVWKRRFAISPTTISSISSGQPHRQSCRIRLRHPASRRTGTKEQPWSSLCLVSQSPKRIPRKRRRPPGIDRLTKTILLDASYKAFGFSNFPFELVIGRCAAGESISINTRASNALRRDVHCSTQKIDEHGGNLLVLSTMAYKNI